MCPGIFSDILPEKGLRRVMLLREILHTSSFLVDTIRGEECLRVYPRLPKKVHLGDDIVNLFGVHWRYRVDADITTVKREQDLAKVLEIASRGSARASYAFTQRYLDTRQSLWLFVPEGQSWGFHQDVLVPQFERDYAEYKDARSGVVQH